MAPMIRPLVKENMHFKAKVSCQSHKEAIGVVKTTFTEAQLELLRNSCLGHLLDFPNMYFCGALVHSLLLRQVRLVGEDEEGTLHLSIGRHLVHFTQQSFGLIIGLRVGKIPVLDSADPPFTQRLQDRYFDGRGSIRYADMVDAMEGCGDDEDKVKLALVFILEYFLLGKDKKTLIDVWHLQLVDVLDLFNSYPWGQISFERTVGSLRKALVGMADKVMGMKNRALKPDKVRGKYELLGCPYVFQVWAYESFVHIGVNCAKKTGLTDCLRILQWSCDKPPSFTSIETLVFGPKNVEVSDVVPNAYDLSQLYCTRVDATVGSMEQADSLEGNQTEVHCRLDSSLQVELVAARATISDQCHEIRALKEANANLTQLLAEANLSANRQSPSVGAENKDFIVSVPREDAVGRAEALYTEENDDPPMASSSRLDDDGVPSEDNLYTELCQLLSGPAVGQTRLDRTPNIRRILSSLSVVQQRGIRQCTRRAAKLTSPYTMYTYKRKRKQDAFDPYRPCPIEDRDRFISWCYNWLTEVSRESVNLQFARVNLDFFRTLLLPESWLNDLHMDTWLHQLRVRHFVCGVTNTQRWTTTDCLFMSNSVPRAATAKNIVGRKSQWGEDPTLTHYVAGELSLGATPWKDVDVVYCPLNVDNNHWIALALDLVKAEIRLYDSMSDGGRFATLKGRLSPLTMMLPVMLLSSGFYHNRHDVESRDGPWALTRVQPVPQ